MKVRGAMPTHWDLIATHAGVRKSNGQVAQATAKQCAHFNPSAPHGPINFEPDTTHSHFEGQTEMLKLLQQQLQGQREIQEQLKAHHQRLSDVEQCVNDIRRAVRCEDKCLSGINLIKAW
eukprot:gnl/TRDRNA2_/TRDRNA2_175105_c0_seq1.p2 gnl/TRDRNA2_/TRDRNA2_175105_c0~~gnl/TRDRNA2_/TRDRNA2_175105_c0_seq1.p2  ORF type:complete len:120 (-),score=16.19 gnl/TRDRNA2_/TRDRNA2_175105_c0_seq1:170-529(-)